MSRFYRKKLNAQGKYINPPVHAKQKTIKDRITTGTETKLYKFERGPLKETSADRLHRIAKEAEARYYARQAEKEAKRLPSESTPCAKGRGTYLRTDAQRANMVRSAKLRWKRDKNRGPTSVVGLTPEEAREKRCDYQNARNARLRAEAKQKESTSLVITITITDPNKS